VKRKWKVVLIVVGLLVIAGGIVASIKMRDRGVVTVQTGRAVRQDLASIVTASGEIKPRNYVNIGANVIGRISALEVKEGDRVRKSQVVARLEAVQAEADLQAQRASVNSSEAESAAAEAGLKAADENLRTVQATIDRAKAETERARLDFTRTESLFKEKLIARQEYDQRKAALDTALAAQREVEARLAQTKAQREQTASQLAAAQKRIAQGQAVLRRSADQLEKHLAISPIDGVVTNLPVRVGETVVPGVQNTAASLIMTVADMSLITAEVKVDETDIVNVKLDQVADVTVDAIPNKTFKGHVIEMGNTAILRSTGLASPRAPFPARKPRISRSSLRSTTRPMRSVRACPARRRSPRRPATKSFPSPSRR
jgi:HlyD family secretion protein